MSNTILTGPSLSALVASGSVYPSRFVKYGTTDYEVVQCVATQLPVGISQEGAKLPPTDENYSAGLAFSAGDLIGIYGVGRVCLLELGSTVTVGDALGPDADGKGITVGGTTGVDFGAFAKASGVAGDLIQVVVNPGEAI